MIDSAGNGEPPVEELMYITVKMYPRSGGTDTGIPEPVPPEFRFRIAWNIQLKEMDCLVERILTRTQSKKMRIRQQLQNRYRHVWQLL